MKYIQRKDQYGLETVDQFATYREAIAMIAEYHIADPYAEYYISQRPCNDWNEA